MGKYDTYEYPEKTNNFLFFNKNNLFVSNNLLNTHTHTHTHTHTQYLTINKSHARNSLKTFYINNPGRLRIELSGDIFLSPCIDFSMRGDFFVFHNL